jgi:hypothetical protein
MGKDCGEKSDRRQQREQKIEPLDASFSVFSVLSCSCFTNSIMSLDVPKSITA